MKNKNTLKNTKQKHHEVKKNKKTPTLTSLILHCCWLLLTTASNDATHFCFCSNDDASRYNTLW